MAETQSLAALAKAAKKRQAAKRIAAKRKAAERGDAGADDKVVSAAASSSAAPSVSQGKKSKTATAQAGVKRKRSTALAGPTKRLRADQLAWKSVNTSSLPGMDGGGGMMMLEELDGVGVEWEEGADGGRTARFVTRVQNDEDEGPEVKKAKGKGKGKGKGKAEIVEDVEGEDEGDDDEGEEDGMGDGDEADDSELVSDDDGSASAASASADEPDELSSLTFAGLSAADLNDADDEDSAPKFNGQATRGARLMAEKKLPAWRSIPLDARLKATLQGLGFASPTDIQRRALPPALEGRDVVGVAETGSGKTLAYALPILSYILSQPPPAATERRPLTALILCPTRELALQVSEALGRVLDFACPRKAGRPPRVSVGAVVGGLSAHKQQRVVERGADVLVATPGRLWDLLKMNDTLAAGVRGLRFLVIDEADRMIETGHFAELEHIVGLTQRSGAHDEAVDEEEDPTFRAAGTELTRAAARDDMQTFVFSATLSKDLQTNLKRRGGRRPRPHGKKTSSTLEDLVSRLDFRDDAPDVVDLSPDGGLVATLRESQVECVTTDKDLYLYYFLLRYPGRSLVFTGSIDGIRRLIPLFETLKVPVYPLHSQLQQKQRLKNLDRFRSQPNAVLIATDVAARGLDIPAVDHVVHFNLPRSADAYVHRSGRTARAQNPGFALQIVSPEDRGVQRQLMRALGRDKPPPDLPIEAGFLRPLKERIALARDIEKAQHTAKKDAHDKNWLKEAAEAMDVDIDPSMLSDSDSDADAPYDRSGRKSRATANLKARLASLLATPLLARGVSARYPTSGSRVVVDDVLTGAAHGAMLGAPTAAAYQDADGVVAAQPRKAQPKPKAKADTKDKGNGKGKADERGASTTSQAAKGVKARKPRGKLGGK